MILKIHPDNPNKREIDRVVEVLKNGGVIIYPTDTIYGIGCDINQHKAVERLAKIQGVDMSKAFFSFVFSDISHVSDYTKLPTPAFKLIKRNTPGPFTFVLEANSNIPRQFKMRRKTVGVRIPDNNILQTIIAQLGNPMLSSSIHADNDIEEYITDPELINEKYGHLVDFVIDGGYGDNQPSTVVDCTTNDFDIIRQGKGELG